MTVLPFPVPGWATLPEAKRVAMIVAGFRAVKAPIPSTTWDVTHFGVRCGPAGTFDDVLGQLYTDGEGVLRVRAARGTTDPGVPGIYSPRHPAGTAAVSRGWHPRVWRCGTYSGSSGTAPARLAMLQVGTMRVDRQPIPGQPDLLRVPLVAGKAGVGAGVHLHYMGRGDDGRPVGAWSLGCLGYEEEAELIAAVELSRQQDLAHPGWGGRHGLAMMALSDLPSALAA